MAAPGAPGLDSIPVGLSDSGIDLLEILKNIPQPADLSQMAGSSEGKPLYSHIVNQPQVQDVRVVEGKVQAEITNKVIPVSLGGERVEVIVANDTLSVRLQSGEVVPVYVQGGHLTADIVGGLEGLAIQLADEEVGLQAVGAI